MWLCACDGEVHMLYEWHCTADHAIACCSAVASNRAAGVLPSTIAFYLESLRQRITLLHLTQYLIPCDCAAESPLAARGPAVVAAVAAAATAPALGPSSIVVSQPMSSVLSITAPMAAEATVISDLQEEPYAATTGPAFTGPVDGARRAGINDFQQRGGPGGAGPGGGGPGGGGPGRPGPGGPGDGPPQLPGPMMPGPGDDSVSFPSAPELLGDCMRTGMRRMRHAWTYFLSASLHLPVSMTHEGCQQKLFRRIIA